MRIFIYENAETGRVERVASEFEPDARRTLPSPLKDWSLIGVRHSKGHQGT